MPLVKKKRCVPYTPAQMYALVNDVEAYPDFIPWCHGAHVLSRTDDEVRATLRVGRGGISKSFTTCNRLHPTSMIEIQLLDGPFKQLEGYWQFTVKSDHDSWVELDLAFEFSTPFLGSLFGPIFTPMAESLVGSFIQRAEAVYPK